MTRITDDQTHPIGIGEDFAGIAQEGLSWVNRLKWNGRVIKETSGGVPLNRFRDDIAKGVVVKLTLMLPPDASGGINKHQTRPGADSVLLPDEEIGIIDDRVMNVVPLNGGADVRGDLFGGEFRRVNPDDDEMIGEFRFEPPQPRQYMETVNSTIGPKVENHELATEVKD